MATGAQKAAKTRKWNREFQAAPFMEAVGAQPLGGTLWKLPNGRLISASPGKAGKVTIRMQDPSIWRTFGVGDMERIKEWVASGGTLAKEEARKALAKAAHKLRGLLAEHLAWCDGKTLGPEEERQLIERTRAALKACGEGT